MVQCHAVWIQGGGNILHCPPSGVHLAPSKATLTPPLSHPVREGQAIQDGWVSHIAGPPGIHAQAMTHICCACLPSSPMIGSVLPGSELSIPLATVSVPLPLFPCPFMHLVPPPASSYPETLCGKGQGNNDPEAQGCCPQQGREKRVGGGGGVFPQTISLNGQCLFSKI